MKPRVDLIYHSGSEQSRIAEFSGGPLKNELLSTSVASVEFEGGFIKSLRSDHLRQSFTFPEKIEVEIDGTRYQLGVPEQSETYRELTTIDDFLSGNDGFPETGSMEIIRHIWTIAGVRIEREVLLTSLESDDCVLYMRYRSSAAVIVISSMPLVHQEFAEFSKRRKHAKLVSGVKKERGDFLREHIFQIGDTWPRQHVNRYFNYKDASLFVDVDAEGTLSTVSIVGTEWNIRECCIYYASAAFCSDTIFLIEGACWQGAAAAIAYGASAHNTDPLFARCWQGKFTTLLWFDKDKGIANHRRLLMSLTKIQTIFVFGKISFDDYLLLKHILTRKEGLGSEHAPREMSSRRVGKILLVYQDSDFSYTESFMSRLQSSAAEWIRDAQSSAFPAYLPVTEPIVLDESVDQLRQYQQVIWNRFSAKPTKTDVLFLIPDDAAIAGLVAPIARYLHATIGINSDLSAPADELQQERLQEPSVRYILRKGEGSELGLKPLPGSKSTYLILYVSLSDLALQLAILFQNAKLLDLYLMYKSSDGHPELSAAFERSFPKTTSAALTQLGNQVSQGDRFGELELAVARYLIGRDFYARLLHSLDATESVSLVDILSPVNFPLLTPHVIFSGVAIDGGFQNLYSAANLSAAKLLPVLLLDAGEDRRTWIEATGEFGRLVFEASRDGLTPRTVEPLLVPPSNNLSSSISIAAKNVGALFPEATIDGMNRLKPIFATFIPGEPAIPYELAAFPKEAALGLEMSRLIGVDSTIGQMGLCFRTGRLAASTTELTAQMICQSVLVYSVYRESPARFASFGDTLGDLRNAGTEIRDVVEFLQQLTNQLNRKSEVYELQGSKCTTARFLEICNRGLDLVHFAGHAEASGIDFGRSTLRMSDGTLSPLEIRDDLKLNRNPVVVMNACESARPPGLLADAFIQAGAGAFVGTLWPVFDTEASRFARYLIGNLVAGFSIGASLQNAKAKLSFGSYSEEKSAQSWNSYILYGDPTWIPMHENFRSARHAQMVSEALWSKND